LIFLDNFIYKQVNIYNKKLKEKTILIIKTIIKR
jgi:hypothetical protein